MSEIDLTDIHDRLQDILEGQGDLAKVVSSQKPPQITVESQPPSVSVAAPNVDVTTPVKVEVVQVKDVTSSWKFEITARDHNGYIQSFTATPSS